MQISLLKERHPFEKRVALTPETVKKLKALGLDVVVEKGAGVASSISDEAYVQAGAVIKDTPKEALKNANVVIKIQKPLEKGEVDEVALIPKDALLVAYLGTLGQERKPYKTFKACDLQLVPRITRAQSMDVLSSQSNLAGYRAVMEAAHAYPRIFPMMMTAAGTIAPARVLILGAGVAGLQAIATAKRLGAIVSAFDVRAAAKEQVESLGATFIEVPSDEAGEGSGGYAKEMSADYQARQRAKIAEALAKADIIITTALIPGKPAPRLVDEDMLTHLKAGAVVVDMAVEQGGNCALSKLNEVVEVGGGKILGIPNLPSTAPWDASHLFSRNVFSFFSLLWDGEKININREDEIIQAVLLEDTNHG